MYSTMRRAIVLTAVIALPGFQLVGCFPGPMTGPGPDTSGYATAAPPPSGPITEAQWAELEARGRTMAQEAGTASHVATERLQAQGFVVEHVFQLTGGWCYAAAVTWATQAQANVSLMFDVAPDGRRVNEQVGGRRENMSPPGGIIRFCADNSGPANLSISALSAGGAIDPNALLEYSVVVGGSAEAPDAAVARRQSEAERGAAAQAQIDANVAAAEERDRQNQVARCRECREDLVRCREARAIGAPHRSRGITTESTCEGQFRQCSFPNLSDASRSPGEWPCGSE